VCSPAAITAGLSVFGEGQQQIAVREAYKAGETREAILQSHAHREFADKLAASAQRRLQEQALASRSTQKIQRQAAQAAGRIGTSAAAAGVQGRSVQALLNEFKAQELGLIEDELLQEEFRESFFQAEDRASSHALQARLTAAINPVPEPTALGTSLNIFAAGLQGAFQSYDFETGNFFTFGTGKDLEIPEKEEG
jgi:hypothetical protein